MFALHFSVLGGHTYQLSKKEEETHEGVYHIAFYYDSRN